MQLWDAAASAAPTAATPASSLPSARLSTPALSSSSHGSSIFLSSASTLLHPFLEIDNLDDLSGDSGDSSHPEQLHATRSPHRLLFAQQQPSIAATGVAKSAPLDDSSPPPQPPPAPPPPREVELDSCALQSLLPQLLPPALLDPACFNHLSLHFAHETPADNGGGGGGDESSASSPPETATRRDLLDVARNKARASTVWAPLEGTAGSAEGAGGAGETGGAGGPRGPGRAKPAAASTLTPANEVITVCRSAVGVVTAGVVTAGVVTASGNSRCGNSRCGDSRCGDSRCGDSRPSQHHHQSGSQWTDLERLGHVFGVVSGRESGECERARPYYHGAMLGLILGPFALPDCVPAHSPSAPSPTHTILSSPILTPSPFHLPPASIFPTSQPHLAPTLHARFANYIGKLPADQLTTLLDLLFSPSTGIGFNLARYLLGASFNATNSPQLTKDTMHQTNLPGYKPSKAAPYDWAADWR
ncbi:unnamed protein product [Closterium sp. Naga37s-1]|nr:unnamed protein product [Closterium sp. Naga37s-1]